MDSPFVGLARKMRAGLVAFLTVSIASGSHVLGGARAPHPLTLAVLVLLASIPCYLIGRRRLGVGLLLVLLGGGQFAIHHVLMAMASMQPGGHPHGTAAMAHPAAAPGGGSAMLLAHVMATLGTSVLLGWGESLLWVLWSLLRPLLHVPRILVSAPELRPLPMASIRILPFCVLLSGPDLPRGPPRGVADPTHLPAAT